MKAPISIALQHQMYWFELLGELAPARILMSGVLVVKLFLIPIQDLHHLILLGSKLEFQHLVLFPDFQ